MAVAQIRAVTPLNPAQYIAAGAIFSWTPEVTLSDNAGSTIGTPVQWLNSSGPVTLAPSFSITDNQSSASTTALTGPLADSATAAISACAWTSICASFTAVGVGPEQWQLQVVSAGQSLSAADTFSPVVLQVTDSALHPVAAANVEIHQTLSPWGQPCSDRGRCPIAPVDGASSSTLTSDANGIITFTPLEASGSPEITNVAAATGTQGFVSFTLQKHP
jgi:hypothetical protein